MKLKQVIKNVEGIPHMSSKQGSIIYNLILHNHIEQILELGTAHGVGACYMAAALHEKGIGNVLTIDNEFALKRKPNPIKLIERNGLENFATPLFAKSTYNWELMKLIEKNTKDGVCKPIFDFCYMDGAHNFEVDCCAFFLVDKLLKPGGWILFDDLNWTYTNSPSLKDTEWVQSMSQEERETPQVKKIVDLIVKPHPDYFKENYLGEWAIFKKKDHFKDSDTMSIDLNKLHDKNQISNFGRFIRKYLK